MSDGNQITIPLGGLPVFLTNGVTVQPSAGGNPPPQQPQYSSLLTEEPAEIPPGSGFLDTVNRINQTLAQETLFLNAVSQRPAVGYSARSSFYSASSAAATPTEVRTSSPPERGLKPDLNRHLDTHYRGPANTGIIAKAQQVEQAMGGSGYCARAVKRMLREQYGIELWGGSAYLLADQLARNPKFKEIAVDQNSLASLPDGAIVIMGQSAAKPHGHAYVKAGSEELFDSKRPLGTDYHRYGGARAFVLVDGACTPPRP